jgi:hypothetical protein
LKIKIPLLLMEDHLSEREERGRKEGEREERGRREKGIERD